MRLERESGRRAWRWLAALSGLAACGAAVLAGSVSVPRDESDRWSTLVEAADSGGALDLPPGGGGGVPITVRQVYLLAFHDAQDAADPEHVLARADRLAAIGEDGLAHHVRWAARTLLVELGAEPDAPGKDMGATLTDRRPSGILPAAFSLDGARTSGDSGSPAVGSRGAPLP
jgi:hypothetical protein